MERQETEHLYKEQICRFVVQNCHMPSNRSQGCQVALPVADLMEIGVPVIPGVTVNHSHREQPYDGLYGEQIGGPFNCSGEQLETSRATWKSGGQQNPLQWVDHSPHDWYKDQVKISVNANNLWHTQNTCWHLCRRQAGIEIVLSVADGCRLVLAEDDAVFGMRWWNSSHWDWRPCWL